MLQSSLRGQAARHAVHPGGIDTFCSRHPTQGKHVVVVDLVRRRDIQCEVCGSHEMMRSFPAALKIIRSNNYD